MIKYAYNVISKGGRIIIENKESFIEDITRLEGLNLEMIIQQRRSKPSPKQRGYYWAYLIPECWRGLLDQGWEITDFPTVDSVHEMLKDMYCPKETIFNKDTGENITLPPSTEKLNTKQREEYHESIRRWGAQHLGIYLKEPNEQTDLNFEI